MGEALIACRAVHYVSLIVAFGAGAFPIYALADGDPGILAGVDRWVRRLLLVVAVVATLSALLLVPLTGSEMAGSASAAVDWPTISTVMLRTAFGRVWQWHLLIASLLVVLSAMPRVQATCRAVLAGLLLASLGLVGHAAVEEGLIGIGHKVNDAVHLLTTGLWLGGLVPLGALALRTWRSNDRAWLSLLQQALPRFSRVAYGAVGLVALSGFVNAVLLVGSIEGLTDTAYGRLVLAKIALFLLLLAVAVINRFVLTSWILHNERPWSGTAAMSWTIATEQVLGLGVIVVVSFLGTLPPAMHMHHH